MKNKLLAKLMILALLVSTLSIVTCVQVKASPGYTVTEYDNAVVKAADRLNETQNNDGTWEWTNPDLNPTNTGWYTSVGLTALGLLDAYELTGNSTYLDKAENRSAIYIKNNLYKSEALGILTYPDVMGTDLQFLVELSDATGNDTYRTWASEDWNWRKTNSTTNQWFGDGNQSAIVNKFVTGVSDGYASQECVMLILAAIPLDRPWAIGMADEITRPNGLIANLTTGDLYWPFAGIALKALQDLNATAYASAISYLENLFETNQNPDGSWGNPTDPFWFKVRYTAYATMGEISVGNLSVARAGADWLVANQNPTTGGWSGSVESTGGDSEAAQALKATADAACISQGDLSLDRTVNMLDVIVVADSFGSEPGDPKWNPDADLNGDDKVNILEAIIVAGKFGKKPT